MRCGETTEANRRSVSVPAAALAVALRTMPGDDRPGVKAARDAFTAALGHAPEPADILDSEANRTSEARMRAAVTDAVAAIDRHGDSLNRDEAISVLGVTLGTYALAWGGEEEVVGKAGAVARALVVRQRGRAGA